MLKQNGTLLAQYPFRLSSGAGNVNTRYMWGRTERQNRYGSWVSATPRGHAAPSAWILAKRAGTMSTVNESEIIFTFSATGRATRQMSTAIPVTFTLTASGSATLPLSTTMPITFSVAGSVSAAIGSSVSMPITFSSSLLLGGIIPMNASIPVTFNLTGPSTSTASMIWQAIDQSLTPVSIAQAVWDSLAAENNTTGTMGEKLNDAGSASNPWTEIIESGLTAAEILRIILAVQAGKSDISGSTVTFRDVDDTKDRVTATVTSSERTAITLDGA